MISVTTRASRSAFSFNSHAGMLSGHDAFARLSEESFLKTQNSVAKGRVLISACGSSSDTSGERYSSGRERNR